MSFTDLVSEPVYHKKQEMILILIANEMNEAPTFTNLLYQGYLNNINCIVFFIISQFYSKSGFICFMMCNARASVTFFSLW